MSHQYFALMEIEQIANIVTFARQSGLLEELHEAPASADQIARRKGGDHFAYVSLLETLRGMGYVKRSGDFYVSTQQNEELRRDISFCWDQIPTFLKTGKPWIAIDSSPESLDAFYTDFFESVGYANQMVSVADAVAVRLDSEPQRILDVGTGTGLWSLAMARILPKATVVAVDFPNVLKNHFFKRAEYFGCRDRVNALTGDFHMIPFPMRAFDRIVMGSSFHFVKESLADAYVQKVRNALAVGGEFVVIDHFADTTPQKRLSRTLYEMRLAMRTQDAKNYSRQEIIRLCSRSGMIQKDSFEVEGPGFLSVLVFEKAAND